MRKIFLSFFLLINIVVFCQPGDTTISAARKKEIDDSLNMILSKISDSVGTPLPIYDDTATVKREVNAGLDYFVRMQEERRKDEKKSAMLKIALGILLLAVLIFGLMRKPSKKERKE